MFTVNRNCTYLIRWLPVPKVKYMSWNALKSFNRKLGPVLYCHTQFWKKLVSSGDNSEVTDMELPDWPPSSHDQRERRSHHLHRFSINGFMRRCRPVLSPNSLSDDTELIMWQLNHKAHYFSAGCASIHRQTRAPQNTRRRVYLITADLLSAMLYGAAVCAHPKDATRHHESYLYSLALYLYDVGPPLLFQSHHQRAADTSVIDLFHLVF